MTRGLVLAVVAVFGVASCSATSEGPGGPPASAGPASRPAVAAPPAGAAFDYQLGGAYEPPDGVRVLSRDRTADAAPGVYSICYVNAFQAQPGAEGEWDPDLLLRGTGGEPVIDEEWDEALLDLRTENKRTRVAAKVGRWIDECAAKGYRAVEPDNFDSYTRSQDLLTADEAQAFFRLLAAHAHRAGLAIAQKNTSDLAPRRQANGADFAVVEECGEQDNCGDYTPYFADNVIVIEYTDEGLANACAKWGSLSIVRRDKDVLPQGSAGYVRESCR
ncbi:endo alpha-1,4 polygalactosaminidase [Actinokineospora bangkokensis]|uniref:Glycoside-hydrolase family GH114 TIM-barrel domain-containing protein n=1 Tax=Actinokineospora bangkokensis TaxID=1193682 RepID=A0A1Q9LN83_9PSEU|nr:endo alpha-1,4 polygalactosaminidase [Actinokineospora bangkokensis]OLR93475.1 hypothetical protein BJP25_14300 [Actinokineospora bangkokensis]